ncbi:MAG TPA: HK97 family phage prohead protease, partial [Planctomycetota bacterium]|nr:HK97 family phage prohead protease [Planctomycetota bacterium]
QDEFVDRCMSHEMMKSEYTDNDQRLAVCFSLFKNKDKNSMDDVTELVERRYSTNVEVRLAGEEDAESNAITGYAAVFNAWSEDLGFFKEKIAKGAFAKSILENDIRALINHDPNLIIGRTRNKTLKLWEDDKGLGFEVELPDTTYAKDLRESIKRKDITQNSFGFSTVQDQWSPDGKRRTLLEARLYDVSPVTFPAYKQTNVKMRLQELGIDYVALSTALIRVTRGMLIQSDIDLVEATIKILRKYVPDHTEPLAVEPVLPEHSALEPEPALVATLIRARLASLHIRQILGRRPDNG